MMETRACILVVGAQAGSLGAAVCKAGVEAGFTAYSIGVSREEDQYLDLLTAPRSLLRATVREVKPQHIVCTMGINQPYPADNDMDLPSWYLRHFEANVVGPMRLLEEYRSWIVNDLNGDLFGETRHYVAISSNSAVIPRTGSAAYCASKAALSQALRVKAREAQGGDNGCIVYGYEPGWLEGTPMSKDIRSQFAAGAPMHRMRGQDLEQGVPAWALARQIVAGLKVPGAALNGALLRYDGGEL